MFPQDLRHPRRFCLHWPSLRRWRRRAGRQAAKIGIIDVQRILTDSALGKDAIAKIKQLQDAKLAEAKTKQTRSPACARRSTTAACR
jgi:hypothetical protein